MYFGLFLIAFALLLTLVVLYFIGFFSPLSIKDSKIGPFLLLYRDFRGDLEKIDPLLKKFSEDLGKYFNPDKSFKIIYDNPLAISQKNSSRAIYGLVLDESEPLERIHKFCKRFEDIKFKLLPEIPSIHIKLENKKSFRFNNSVFQAKILPKLVLALKAKLEMAENNVSFVGLVEVQELRSIGDKTLRFAIPYGENTNEYFLTNYPEPNYAANGEH